MKKIKITLTNGNIIEKPLITAFKGTYGDYVVLDNESVGSMGLPVILISKVQDANISTIVDANEWNAVKENLRNIIAGNQIIKINVLDAYNGEEVFYKQLTLPVASFDALKNTGYSGEQPVAEVMPSANASAAPMEPTPAPVAPSAPSMPEAPVAPASPVNMETSVEPAPEVAPVMPTPAPVEPTPSVEPVASVAPSAPSMPEAPVMPETPVAPASPINMETSVEPAPEVAPIPDVNEQAEKSVDLTSEKEAFLKACENMFDALVAKFNS